jgi:hypothetical protein
MFKGMVAYVTYVRYVLSNLLAIVFLMSQPQQ